jgi:hypothetical protein
MSNYGWIAAWTLDNARLRLKSDTKNGGETRFSSSPLSIIKLKNKQTSSSSVNADTLAFVGFGTAEYNGLVFEASAFQFKSQDEAEYWLTSSEGQSWLEHASGVNMIQIAVSENSI